MLGSPAGPGGTSQRGLWPLAPAPAPTATSFSADGLSKYGVYSLFPGGPSFGSALYSHASTIGRFASGQLQQSSGNTFHAAHKDSLFSTSGYSTFGAPTPPPGSPYSPIPVAQLELLTKGFTANSNSIIIQQPVAQAKITEKCEDKCCSIKTQKTCNCQIPSPIKSSKYPDSLTGCSRTNPIEWGTVNVKKEPGACQVAEISTSASPIVKLEVTSPTQKNVVDSSGIVSSPIISTNASSIPVGIAIARQRVQHEVIASPSLPPAGLLTTVNGGGQIKEIARISEIDPAGVAGSMAASSTMGGQTGGTFLQCTDDRGTGLAAWQMGGTHSQALATPTLWQYPAPVPVEPMVPLPVPMPPVGFQLVRDPTTGGLLLLPTTTGIEPLQQAVVWPSYPQPSSVLLPTIPNMHPPPLQLLSSASSDYLSSSTTLHQHTQTHSTRLVAVTTDAKRKIPMPIPATTLIKIETDATLDQTKTLQAVNTVANNTSAVFTDQNMVQTPLVTTHVIYQHPTNLILSQTPAASTAPVEPTSTTCRSQATSPVTCLTPPPEIQTQEEELSTVQDASNQTDTPICSEDDTTTHTIADVSEECKNKLEPHVDKVIETISGKECDTTDVLEVEVQPPIAIPLPELMEQEPVQSTIPDEETKLTEINAIEQDNVSSQKPDLSGLELLSNSIVEFESCRSSVEEEKEIPSIPEKPVSVIVEDKADTKPKLEDNLGGLDLLCALAEQRIKEEIEKPKKDKEKSKERKREKRKSKKHSSDEPKRKKMKSDKHRNDDYERKKRKDRHSSEKSVESDKEKQICSCHTENYRTYKNQKSEEEVKKFIASKSQRICCKGDWPCMNAMELDMRIKLAELQREYREKQKELSKLKTKRHSSDCSKKRSRKKSTHSLHSDRSLTPPPLLDKMDIPVKSNKSNEFSKSPTLIEMPKLEEIYKTHSDSDTSPEKHSSSKKRKVGRPKKLLSSPGESVATETIVAKKPKTSFVGYLLAAKEKLKLQTNGYPDATPPRYLEETFTIKPKKMKNNNHIVQSEIKSSKIRPKLKAEATIKAYTDDDHQEWETISDEDDDSIDHIEEDMDVEENANKIETESIPEDEMVDEKTNALDDGIVEEEITEEVKPEDTRCILTSELLEVDKLRVLTAMGGLFYAGQLNALEPPDVYSITLDGERGNRPHIMSREEIQRDAIVEVSPKSTEDLPVGTRICAYWSQQYRCLYPGSVAEPGTPDPQLDGKFVSVEFDDGDSGTIALEDIRLLPPDYPIIEYDPNPLLSLSKRRRRASTSVSTEEKVQKPSQPITVTITQPIIQNFASAIQLDKENKQVNKTSDRYKEKKRLKKKKREKMRQKLLHEDKKKKKKHKCDDENCKHRKHHKKHRKHKKHHDKSKVEDKEQRIEENVEEVQEEVDEVTEGDNAAVDDVEAYPTETNDSVELEEYHDDMANPEDEVTMDDIIEATKTKKSKKIRDRQESCESRSKMSAFLPARQLWGWAGKGYKRQRAKGRSKKSFYKSIQRGKEMITVGDSAVFLSTGRPDRPYIGRIEAMWELCGTMVVRVKWFYHPEETVGCPQNLQYPGALFESPHIDENDVQTIAHKCEVLPLKDYTERLGDDPQRYATIYDNNDIYYLAGYYDPTTHTIKMEPGIPFVKTN